MHSDATEMHKFKAAVMFEAIVSSLHKYSSCFPPSPGGSVPRSPPLLALWCPLWLGGVLSSLAFKGGGKLWGGGHN